MTIDRIKAELARRELAKRSIFDFTIYTKPEFVPGWFNRELASLIDGFVEGVKNRKSPRLIITVPPRFGKSEYVSRRLPAYFLSQTPNLEFIGATHTQTLADINGGDVRDIMLDPKFRDLFNTNLDPRFTARDFLKLDNGSSFKSVGIGTGLPGFGAHILSVDDFFPGPKEANSQTERDNIWNWLSGSAFNRVYPGGGVIITATRWHVDDPIGRILSSSERSRWVVFEYPAIAEKDEKNRKVGESLHPERWSVEELMIRKAEASPRDWASLFQCRPYIDSGNFFKKEHFKFYPLLPTETSCIVAADYAVSEKAHADKSAIGVLHVDHKGDVYLGNDYEWGRFGTLDSVRKTISLAKKHNTRQLASETGPIQAAFDPVMQREMREQSYYITIEKNLRRSSKANLAHGLRALLEAGKFYLPDTKDVRENVVPQLLAFDPNADSEDDFVDMLVNGCSKIESVAPPIPPRSPTQKDDRLPGEIRGDDIWKPSVKRSGIPPLRSGRW